MQDDAADQLHVEVAHVEHAASGFANHRESLHQNFVQHFLQSIVLLFFQPLLAVDVGLGFIFISGISRNFRGASVREASHALLDPPPKFIRLGAQLGVGELLDLRLKRIDSRHLRHQGLDDALVFRPENLA